MNLCHMLRNRCSGNIQKRKGKTKRKHLAQLSEEKLIHHQRAFSAELPPATRSTYAITFSADRRYAATSTGDHNIHIIRINDGKIVKTLVGHTRTCWSVVFHPTNPNLLASGDLSAEVRVWDISDPLNGYEVWRHCSGGMHPHSKISISLTFHPTDNVLLIAVQNELRIWDWKERVVPFATIKTNSEREKVSYIRLSPLGNQLITAIQQSNEVNEVEQLMGSSLLEESRGEPAGLREGRTLRSSALSRLRIPHHFPHPRNNEHPLRFSLRNPYAQSDLPTEDLLVEPVPSTTTSPSNEDILQAATNPTGPLEDLLRKRRRYENDGSIFQNMDAFHRRNIEPHVAHNDRRYSRRNVNLLQHTYYFNRLNRRNIDSFRRMRDDKKLCRLQIWDFSPENLPEISLPEIGLLQRRVKLNNDSSCSIAADFSKIFCIVQPNENRNQLQLTLISLKKENLGDILWVKDCTSDYLSCSLSPIGDYVSVGMKVRSSQSAETKLIEFFKLTEEGQTNPAGILYADSNQSCQFVINAIAFMPCAGQGLMYGTSTGELKIVVPSAGKGFYQQRDINPRNPTVQLERVRVGRRFLATGDVPRAGSPSLPRISRHPEYRYNSLSAHSYQRRQQWLDLRRRNGPGFEIFWPPGRTGRARVSLNDNSRPSSFATLDSETSSDNLLENINEFNIQLSQWQNRIEINSDDQIRVIRDTLDQTRTMVETLRDHLASVSNRVRDLNTDLNIPTVNTGTERSSGEPASVPSTSLLTLRASGLVQTSSDLQLWLADVHNHLFDRQQQTHPDSNQ